MTGSSTYLWQAPVQHADRAVCCPSRIAGRSKDALIKSRFAHFDDRAKSYVVKPISSAGKITINKKVGSTVGGERPPTHDLELTCEEVAMVLSDQQFRGACKLTDYFAWLAQRVAYKHLRPTSVIRGASCAEWWQFAKEAVGIDWKRRKGSWSWANIRVILRPPHYIG